MIILAVLVVYNIRLDQSSSFRSLIRCLEQPGCESVHVLIYDNSPSPVLVGDSSKWITFHYRHDPENGGVSAAYNCGLDLANQLGSEWMLLLDQDSELPSTFIIELQRAITDFGDEKVVAIVPEVIGKRSLLSPKLVHFGHLSSMARGMRGLCCRQLTAINCGVAVRTSFLSSLGGFSRRYWLDFLDYWLFSKIFQSGKIVALSGAVIKHNLSLESEPISLPRYANMLDAEAAFICEERPSSELPLYLVRLLARTLKQACGTGSLALARLTATKLGELVLSQLFAKRMQCI